MKRSIIITVGLSVLFTFLLYGEEKLDIRRIPKQKYSYEGIPLADYANMHPQTRAGFFARYKSAPFEPNRFQISADSLFLVDTASGLVWKLGNFPDGSVGFSLIEVEGVYPKRILEAADKAEWGKKLKEIEKQKEKKSR